MSELKLSALARTDSRLRAMQLIAGLFVVGPLIFSVAENGKSFFPAYVRNMLFGFSWPLLVLLGLVAYRLFRLNGLLKRGIQFSGTVERVRSARWSHTADVRFTSDAGDRTVRVYVPSSPRYSVYEGSRVSLLVDPRRPDMAVIVGAG